MYKRDKLTTLGFYIDIHSLIVSNWIPKKLLIVLHIRRQPGFPSLCNFKYKIIMYPRRFLAKNLCFTIKNVCYNIKTVTTILAI